MNITAKIIECQSKLKQVIKSAVEASTMPPILNDPHHTSPSVIIPPSTVSQARTWVPKLELPKFKGYLTTWTG